MAEMRPPPPRYRIVEHKGRLIATDTWAENRPTRGDAPPPRRDMPAPRVTVPARPTRSSARPEPGRVGIDALGSALVLVVCAGYVDPAGQPILTTRNYFDVNGPREIVLDRIGAQRLGRWLAAMLVVAVSLIILACVFQDAFLFLAILIGLGASSINTTARPVITRWLDRLGQD